MRKAFLLIAVLLITINFSGCKFLQKGNEVIYIDKTSNNGCGSCSTGCSDECSQPCKSGDGGCEPSYCIGGKTWFDNNEDGLFNSGDKVLAHTDFNVTLNDSVIEFNSDKDGKWEYCGVKPGDTVKLSYKGTYVPTKKTKDNLLNSDGVSDLLEMIDCNNRHLDIGVKVKTVNTASVKVTQRKYTKCGCGGRYDSEAKYGYTNMVVTGKNIVDVIFTTDQPLTALWNNHSRYIKDFSYQNLGTRFHWPKNNEGGKGGYWIYSKQSNPAVIQAIVTFKDGSKKTINVIKG